MAAYILDSLAHSLGRSADDVDLDKSFIENGGHSLAAYTLSTSLRRQGIDLPIEKILASRRLSEIDLGPVAEQFKRPSLSALNISRSSSVAGSEWSELFNSSSKSSETASTNPASYSGSPPDAAKETRSRAMRTNSATSIDVSPHSSERMSLYDDHINTQSQNEPDTLAYNKKQAKQPPPVVTFLDMRHTNLCSRRRKSLAEEEAPVLTEMQLALIHGSLKNPGTNIIHYSETYKSEYLPLVRIAWQRVISLEPIFQTKFPEQFVSSDQIAFEWKEVIANNKEQYHVLVEAAFDDTRIGSMFRVVTLPSNHAQSISTIVWSVHHALIDGYSASIVLEKVRKVAAGLPVHAGPSFSEVVRDLHSYQVEHKESGDKFWEGQKLKYASGRGDLLLPIPKLPATPLVRSEEVRVHLGSDYAKISRGAQASGVTVAALVHAALALTLSRFMDSDLVVFGSVFSGRNLPLSGIEETVGPFVNVLPLCVTINRDVLAEDFLRTVFQSMIEMSGFQWTTLEDRYTRSFEVAVAMQFDTTMKDGNYSVVPLQKPDSKQTTDIPLSIAVESDGTVRFQYHTNRFLREHIQSLGNIFRQALHALCSPRATVQTCLASLMSIELLSTLREWGNASSGLTTKPSVTEDLVTLFEKTARNFPKVVAAMKGKSEITYEQLDQGAAQFSHRLREIVQPGDVICTHSDRSLEWLIAIYGILKAGATYCSMNPSLPPDLKDSMYKAAGAKAFIAAKSSQESFKPRSCENFIPLDGFLKSSSERSIQRTPHRDTADPGAAAYLCFTSGSTGVPKGVICMHQGLVAFQNDLEVRLFAQPGQRVAQIMSPEFDGSIHEMFSALSYGATLVFPSDSLSMFDHLKLATSCILTPSIARVLDPKMLPDLKQVYLVGEPVPTETANLWSRHVALYNMYGPTEATCGATIKRLLPDQEVTIGGPNPTTRIYIMDSKQSLVPPGTIGEIYLAGVQVSRGYIGLPEITKERFLPDPICRVGEYMYKTGDRGYWTENGEVMCLGRNDREIKLRGFRLNLDDLEIQIARACPGLDAVAVLTEKEQILTVVRPAAADVKDLKKKIAAALPVHAIPARIVAVDEMPMTRAGKTDYKSLPSLFKQVKSSARQLVTPTEKKVAEAVRSVLKLDPSVPIYQDSHFGELGGTSLKQVSLSSRLTNEMGSQVPLKLVIERPLISPMAKAIDEIRQSNRAQTQSLTTLGKHSVSPIEQEWMDKYELGTGTSAFNVFYTAKFCPSKVDRHRLTNAWNTVLSRHVMLRSQYVRRRGDKVVRVFSKLAPQAQKLSSISAWAEANRPFYVDKTNPIRVFIGGQAITVTMSHIIADFTTLSILLGEAAEVYAGGSLPPLTRTYSDSTIWNEEPPICYRSWWPRYLALPPDEPSVLRPDRERTSYHGTSLVSKVDRKTFEKMEALSQQSGVTMQQIALAAVGLVLSDEEDKVDIIMGTPYINRPSDDDLATVGLYLEPLPVRVTYPPSRSVKPCPDAEVPDGSPIELIECYKSIDNDDGSTDSYLKTVHRSSQAALAHAIPWNRLLEHMAIEPAFPNHPITDVMVSFHETSQTSKLMGDSIEGIRPCFVWSEGSKFKLMVEFSALTSETLMMRLEYDTDIFTSRDIYRVEAKVAKALELLVKGNIPVTDILKGLAQVHSERPAGALNAGQVFGTDVSLL